MTTYKRVIQEHEKESVIKFYLEGNSLKRTGSKFCIGDANLRNFLTENNIPIRGVGGIYLGNSVKTRHAYSRRNSGINAGSKCAICGGIERLHVHHMDRDETNSQPENLVFLCPRCHQNWHWRQRYDIEFAKLELEHLS
jgi:hypothetical protein